MGVKKILGYIVSLLGLAVLSLTFEQVLDFLNTPLPVVATQTNLIIAGLVLIAIGVFLLLEKKKTERKAEIPIYEGRKIVGYRRD
jgi:hypothetical protein